MQGCKKQYSALCRPGQRGASALGRALVMREAGREGALQEATGDHFSLEASYAVAGGWIHRWRSGRFRFVVEDR